VIQCRAGKSNQTTGSGAAGSALTGCIKGRLVSGETRGYVLPYIESRFNPGEGGRVRGVNDEVCN
jgi:hypothetical protein